jgi:hypothetical protein
MLLHSGNKESSLNPKGVRQQIDSCSILFIEWRIIDNGGF